MPPRLFGQGRARQTQDKSRRMSSAEARHPWIIASTMVHLALDCTEFEPDVYRRCLSAAQAVLAAAGFTAQDVLEAMTLLDGRGHHDAESPTEMPWLEVLAAFSLAEMAAQSEGEAAVGSRLLLVENTH